MTKGKVYLVGSGPGDESLITYRAIKLLKQADCVIYDGLVNPALLKYAKNTAELISVRKRTGPNPFKQPEINNLIVEEASQGKIIVRLKGGDPGMFGRASEEVAVCVNAGIDFEIIPGITAGLAAAEYSGIFLSDRRHSSQVIFVTGREAEGKEDSSIDFDLLAKFKGSIVFYMAMGSLPNITAKLMQNGKADDTPVVVIENATTPDHRIMKSTLANVAKDCKTKQFNPPAIVIIGESAAFDERFNWFINRPLYGKRIVITRDKTGNEKLAQKILEQGGKPFEFNSIEIQDLTNSASVKNILANLNSYNWIIFTSANGITHTFKALIKEGKDARVFGGMKIACIGTESAKKLSTYGINADFVPTVYTSDELSKQLIAHENLQGQKILLLRSAIAPKNLPSVLSDAGAIVEDIAVYTVITKQNDPAELIEQIKSDRIDWLTFTSSSTVRGFFDIIAPDIVNNSNVKIASIGPITTEQLKDYGVEVHIEAQPHTIDGLICALIEGVK